MRSAGFTLLELLVAMVVLGFILAGLTGGARYGLRAAQTQARLADGRGDLDAVDRTLRRMIAEAIPPAGATATLRGGPGTLTLVSLLPDGTPAEIGLGLDRTGRLVLRDTPRGAGKRTGPPPTPRETELQRDVAGLQLSYWTAEGGGRWVGAWGEPNFPGLIRVRITFPEGDPRHWPDLVLAPMRSRAGSAKPTSS